MDVRLYLFFECLFVPTSSYSKCAPPETPPPACKVNPKEECRHRDQHTHLHEELRAGTPTLALRACMPSAAVQALKHVCGSRRPCLGRPHRMAWSARLCSAGNGCFLPGCPPPWNGCLAAHPMPCSARAVPHFGVGLRARKPHTCGAACGPSQHSRGFCAVPITTATSNESSSIRPPAYTASLYRHSSHAITQIWPAIQRGRHIAVAPLQDCNTELLHIRVVTAW